MVSFMLFIFYDLKVKKKKNDQWGKDQSIKFIRDFPCGSVVENPPSKAGGCWFQNPSPCWQLEESSHTHTKTYKKVKGKEKSL